MTHCDDCGAPLPLSVDGVSGACSFCDAGKPKTIDHASLSHSLAKDIHDIHKFVEHLAAMLEASFATHTHVERSGLFSKKVSKVEVTLDDHVFRLETDGHHATAHRARVVRGVTVKNATLQLPEWVGELARGLAGIAEQNAQAREALSRFVS
jgi:hypothetical protein